MIVKGCVIFEKTILSRKKSHNLAWSCATVTFSTVLSIQVKFAYHNFIKDIFSFGNCGSVDELAKPSILNDLVSVCRRVVPTTHAELKFVNRDILLVVCFITNLILNFMRNLFLQPKIRKLRLIEESEFFYLCFLIRLRQKSKTLRGKENNSQCHVFFLAV